MYLDCVCIQTDAHFFHTDVGLKTELTDSQRLVPPIASVTFLRYVPCSLNLQHCTDKWYF